MVHIVVATGVLTDTDARCADLRTRHSSAASWLRVLAMHLRLRLLVPTRSAIGFRIVIIDVDVVIVYDLNDFAGRALAKLPELQLAKAKGIQLLLQLITRVLCCPVARAPSMLSAIPHEHLRMSLTRCVLGASTHLRLLVSGLPLLS